MIRVVLIASLTALLVLVLYLPSAHPPQRFLAHLQVEQAQLATFWGSTHAERVLARTIATQATAHTLAPDLQARELPHAGYVGSAVEIEMSAVNARLFNSAYLRSVDALLLLATFRLFVLLEWIPWLAWFACAALIDAGTSRVIKSKTLAHHDPELFAACALGALLTVCCSLVAFLTPATLHPLLFPTAPIALALLVAASVRHYHRR